MMYDYENVNKYKLKNPEKIGVFRGEIQSNDLLYQYCKTA